jgi:hypothetical protein
VVFASKAAPVNASPSPSSLSPSTPDNSVTASIITPAVISQTVKKIVDFTSKTEQVFLIGVTAAAAVKAAPDKANDKNLIVFFFIPFSGRIQVEDSECQRSEGRGAGGQDQISGGSANSFRPGA